MKPAKQYKRTCTGCGEVFYAQQHWALYCSKECRKKMQYQRQKWRKAQKKREALLPPKEKYRLRDKEGTLEWWAEYMGMPQEVIEKRIAAGWTFKDAIMFPCRT